MCTDEHSGGGCGDRTEFLAEKLAEKCDAHVEHIKRIVVDISELFRVSKGAL